MKEKPIYLKFVNTGVANRFDLGDHELIEMNKRVPLYPKLFYNVLMHELEHEDGGFKPKDLTHDLKSRTPGLFKFMKNHITAWTQITPFYWDFRRNQLVYDISAIVSWLMAVGLAGIVFFGLRWLL